MKICDIISPLQARGYSSVGRALRSQRRGLGFEPRYLHQPGRPGSQISVKQVQTCFLIPQRGVRFLLSRLHQHYYRTRVCAALPYKHSYKSKSGIPMPLFDLYRNVLISDLPLPYKQNKTLIYRAQILIFSIFYDILYISEVHI